MLKLLKAPDPEDLFVQRYDLLMRWALALTNHNEAQAEDLVHDAFIQFTLRSGSLSAIENTDAYLHRMLRNMYLSQIRRAAVTQESRFSIANFDSAEMGLRRTDQRDDIHVQDELRQICQYACARKETSKAGCVLILRFFHGYYPSEIAQILRTTRKAANQWLQIARREAKVYLTEPGSLKFAGENPKATVGQFGYAQSTAGLLSDLRQTIFAARHDECSSPDQLKELYREKAPATIDAKVLSHIASCASCLDEVNRLLGLPLLSERGFDDRLGRDVPPSDMSGGGGAGTGGSVVESKKRYQRRLKETIEHRPQELRIAVNGFVLGAQQVSSEVNKQVLSINVDEPIGFIEVFSEQDVRLLFFDVEQAIDGRVEQSTTAEFDSGRTLDLSLSFRSAWPTLHVSYTDPTFEVIGSEAGILSLDEEVQSPKSKVKSRDGSQTVRERFRFPVNRRGRVMGSIRKLIDLGPWTLDFGLLSRPGTVTALFALALILIAVVVYRPVPTSSVSAADLLQRAAAAEEAIASNRDHVLHRTVRLEEKSLSGQLIASRRIEVWHSAEKGITARRLYDENGSLIAGDWRRVDGVRTVYHHRKRPEIKLESQNSSDAPIVFESVWQLDPTAKEFTALIGDSQNAQAQVTDNAYVISYHNSNATSSGLISASLVLGHAELHALEQTIVVRQADEVREFRFTEISFESRRSDSVAPAVFEPDAELVSSSKSETLNLKPETASPLALAPSPVMATAALEVDVIEALNKAGAFVSGEQVNVSRTADGKIKVSALVETNQRKRDLIAAVVRFRSNPTVQTRIETVAEAEARARQAANNPTISLRSTEQRQVAEHVSPVFEDLKKHFSEEEARRYSERVLMKSRQAWLHAAAMKQLSQRFSAADLAGLSPAERSRWLGLIRGHADSFFRQAEALRRELAQVFPQASASVGSAGTIGSDTELQARVRELYEAAVAVDRGMNSSFGVGSDSAAVNGPGFWNSFSRALGLARSVQGVR